MSRLKEPEVFQEVPLNQILNRDKTMQKTIRFCLMGAVCAVMTMSASAAHADVTGSGSGSKPIVWSWWPSHWDKLDFNPYLEHPTHPHNSQWDRVEWSPEDWAAQRDGSRMKVINGFYTADVLHKQYIDDEIPVLEVGPAFYMLGGHDKRRVMETVDQEFGITTSRLNGMFMVRDWRTGKDIGAYTAYGLQLQ